MSFPKINCVFHPEQILTNFCVQKNCLLPLCPTCIKIHTTEHISLKTNPKYQQINELMSQVSKELKECSILLSNNLKIIGDIEERKKRNKQILLEKLGVVRKEIISILENHFNELEVQIDQTLKHLDITDQIEIFKKSIYKHIDSFKLLDQSLFCPKAMRTVIKFKGEQVREKTLQSNKITKQFLNKCENSILLLDLQMDYKNMFKNCLKSITYLKHIPSFQPRIQPFDITDTLAQIRQQSAKSTINHNKIQKKSKNNILDSISLEHNRSKRSISQQGKRNRPGLQLVHLDQFQTIGRHNKKVSFNRGVQHLKYSKQNMEFRTIQRSP